MVALDARTLVATGPSGSDLSTDGGVSWRPLGPQGFHALARARRGSALFAAGAGGRVARIELGAIAR